MSHPADEPFEEVPHAADLAIVVRGADPAGLYARAALALYALLVEPAGVRPAERRRVEVEGLDREDLLHEWLARLLSEFYTEGFVGRAVHVARCEDTRLEADLDGDRFDRARHALRREIKAVTFHQLAVRPAPGGGWEARITFDV
ncbi:MAG TPA: archease [Candidatus Saccharimonadales bacterium]|nr:archease [Candidatus Saccharimonadales bacterium]